MAIGLPDEILVECGAQQVGVLDHRVEERALAGGLVVGDGGLHHVPGAVHFMAAAQADPAALHVASGDGGVEIAVGFLGGDYLANDVVGVFLQLGVGFGREGVGGAFEDLGEVRIIEPGSLVCALFEAALYREVADPACLLTLLQGVRDEVIDGNIHLLLPEAAGDVHAGEWDGGNGVVLGRAECGSAAHDERGENQPGKSHWDQSRFPGILCHCSTFTGE